MHCLKLQKFTAQKSPVCQNKVFYVVSTEIFQLDPVYWHESKQVHAGCCQISSCLSIYDTNKVVQYLILDVQNFNQRLQYFTISFLLLNFKTYPKIENQLVREKHFVQFLKLNQDLESHIILEIFYVETVISGIFLHYFLFFCCYFSCCILLCIQYDNLTLVLCIAQNSKQTHYFLWRWQFQQVKNMLFQEIELLSRELPLDDIVVKEN
eukprot:TRINITY_DN5458_c0_g1_i7.p2 TRINITY_DN5458_c0_g1~~TRINITY_DN5458_c0_g1_i7.p2  ORF type:complete len:209 (-),score=-13.84 TRINITY_DN5458_c0_g1_i7:120-746(-)